MKNIKKVLIGTALAGSLVVGAGYGTYSWFTAETSAMGTIDNGTFTLGEMGTLFTNQKIAPSQIGESELETIDNTGSLDQILKATYNHTITPGGQVTLSANQTEAVISKYKVYYFAIKYKEKPKKNVVIDIRDNLFKFINGNPNPALNKAAVAVDPGYEVKQGQLSDQEVQSLMATNQASPTEKTFTLGNGDKDVFWTLTPKQHIDIQFFVKLDNSAGNEFQTTTYGATFKVEAKQTDQGAKFPSQLNGN
jgi:spore coat-associated protein N